MLLSRFITDTIKTNGPKYVFGISGISNLSLYESLEKEVACIQNVHEAHSVYSSMWGYLATKQVHFCIVTAWPGLTNCITPLADAYNSHIPLVLISINNSTDTYGLGDYHDSSFVWGIDTVGITKDITAMSTLATSATNAAYMIEKAYVEASTTWKPTHISIPKNLLDEEVKSGIIPKQLWPFPLKERAVNLSDTSLWDIFVEKVQSAKLPFLVHLPNAVDNNTLEKFLQKTNIVFANTMNNLGTLSDSPYCLGCFEYIRNTQVEKIFSKSDVIIFIGDEIRMYYTRDINDFVHKTVIHISEKPESYSQIFRNYIHICATPEAVLNYAGERIGNIGMWEELLTKLHDSVANSYEKKYHNNLMYRFFIDSNACIPQDSSIFVSVGWVNNFANVFLRTKEKTDVFMSSNFFNMGQSMKIIGYAAYNRSTPNFLFIGDGNFYMNGLDIITAVEQEMNINVVIFNNSWYSSLIRFGEETLWQKYQNTFGKYKRGLHMETFSESLGVPYYHVSKPSDIPKMYKDIDICNGVNIIEVTLDFDTEIPL